MSTHNYTRAINGSVWNINPSTLSTEIEAAIPSKEFVVRANGVDVVIEFVDTLTSGEETTLNATVASHQAEGGLAAAKTAKFAAIDERTNNLIANGFTFSGLSFSLSSKAQHTLLGLDSSRNDPALTYPISYNTKDDNDVFVLSNATDVHNFFLTALGTYRTWLDTGTSIKSAIRAATTVAELDTVVDNR